MNGKTQFTLTTVGYVAFRFFDKLREEIGMAEGVMDIFSFPGIPRKQQP